MKLYISGRYAGVSIQPDDRYPQMWRVLWPDGGLSCMGNLTRAKAAAVSFARRVRNDNAAAVTWNAHGASLEAPPALGIGKPAPRAHSSETAASEQVSRLAA
jgi:hypothetical protein